jgi:hypothetical protein
MQTVEARRAQLQERCDDLHASIRKREREKTLTLLGGLLCAGVLPYFAPATLTPDARTIVITLILGFAVLITQVIEIQARILGSQLDRWSDELYRLPSEY